GSSSIKYRVFQGKKVKCLNTLAKGAVLGLGSPDATLSLQSPGHNFIQKLDRPDHDRGLGAIMALLIHKKQGVIQDPSQIDLVGHRTVHGGDRFTHAVFVDQEVIKGMEKYIPLAPVHNPANLAGIRLTKKLIPNALHVAVFDTAFHQTMPPQAYMYGLPHSLYENQGIRKYGFHGTSCRYVAAQAARLTGQDAARNKLIICHLGNGVTVAAVKNGCSVDTSMGMSPLEGAMMGTRCGDLDPGVVLYLQREMNLTLGQVEKMLNQESGLLGVSGHSNDMEKIIARAQNGDNRSRIALEMFIYRLKKYIGAYAAAMGGIDLLVFTGGMGENSPLIRQRVLSGMEFLGLDLDLSRNQGAGAQDCLLNSDSSSADVALIHTNEELMIARETLSLAMDCSDKKKGIK
ncbi:MAG: acetate kinase, partial [Proteobacteria bacterium]|nr:acetate kinase [Pseudomonadota bacterium]